MALQGERITVESVASSGPPGVWYRAAASAIATMTNMTRWIGLSLLMMAAASRLAAQGPAAPPPRTADGKPDLSGIWQVLNTAAWDIQDHAASLGVPAGQGVVEGNELPYQPSALAKKRENSATRATADPETKCYEPGVPRITYMPYPFQIVQTPTYVAILYEYNHVTRHIYVDGTPHPRGPIDNWLMGDSRARWEGNTLVVDVIHFTNQTWLDRAGNFHSDALHVIERYTPIDRDHIQYEATIEDPKVFTRPWKMSMPLYRRTEANIQLLEYECYTMLQEQRTAAAR
jgi:hypothetical protein